MPILRPKENTQLRIALRYESAKESKSRFGAMEYLYTLANGDLLYVSPQGHQEIQSLKPLPGEPFLLSKTVGKGNAVTWSVERVLSGPVPETKPLAREILSSQNVPHSLQHITKSNIPIQPSLTTRESQRIFLSSWLRFRLSRRLRSSPSRLAGLSALDRKISGPWGFPGLSSNLGGQPHE